MIYPNERKPYTGGQALGNNSHRLRRVVHEAMICYVRECIKLAHDLGSPLCKIFAAWRGITLHDALATYDDTYGYDSYGYWKGDRRGFVVDCLRELVAGGYFDAGFWGRRVAYPAYVRALVVSGYEGYINWEFCHPAREHGEPAGIDYVHRQTELAVEYLKSLRSTALAAPAG